MFMKYHEHIVNSANISLAEDLAGTESFFSNIYFLKYFFIARSTNKKII